MAFIVSKKSKLSGSERKLYYLVRNHREGNKMKREAIVRLGESPNLTEALLCIQEQGKGLLVRLSELENRLERVKKGDLTAFYRFCPPYRQVTRITEYLNNTKNELSELKVEEAKLIELINLYPKCSANKM